MCWCPDKPSNIGLDTKVSGQVEVAVAHLPRVMLLLGLSLLSLAASPGH